MTDDPIRLQALLDEARETITRLNRRCQRAEAAVEMKVEQFQQRSKRALRSYYFEKGREHERFVSQNDDVATNSCSEALQILIQAALTREATLIAALQPEREP